MVHAKRRLPSLNALKAFEAAARHSGFAAAARELCVTPSAISQQVRALESELGVQLFDRQQRGLALTEAGHDYSRRLREAFDALAEATHAIRPDSSADVLTVSTVPSLAARWLIPRLTSFNRAFPGVRVRVLAGTSRDDVDRSKADLIIRYGNGRHPRIVGELPFPRTIFPVCSPALVAGAGAISRPAEVTKHVLLQLDDTRFPAGQEDCDWVRWLRRLGVSGKSSRYSPTFSFTHLMLEAAIAGQGLAITSLALAGDDLMAGRLVRPLADDVSVARGYWLSRGASSTESGNRFADWLMHEVVQFVDKAGPARVPTPAAQPARRSKRPAAARA